jgi:hypothetical protein
MKLAHQEGVQDLTLTSFLTQPYFSIYMAGFEQFNTLNTFVGRF